MWPDSDLTDCQEAHVQASSSGNQNFLQFQYFPGWPRLNIVLQSGHDGAEEADLLSSEASLVCKESSRIARVITQRNLIQNKTKRKKKKKDMHFSLLEMFFIPVAYFDQVSGVIILNT